MQFLVYEYHSFHNFWTKKKPVWDGIRWWSGQLISWAGWDDDNRLISGHARCGRAMIMASIFFCHSWIHAGERRPRKTLQWLCLSLVSPLIFLSVPFSQSVSLVLTQLFASSTWLLNTTVESLPTRRRFTSRS